MMLTFIMAWLTQQEIIPIGSLDKSFIRLRDGTFISNPNEKMVILKPSIYIQVWEKPFSSFN